MTHSTGARAAAVRLASLAGLVAGLTTATACTSAQQASAGDSSVVASLTRGPCRGYCPEYRVDVHRNGAVTFTGGRNVSSTGAHTVTIPGDSVRALTQAIRSSGFAGFDSAYTYGSAGCGRYVTDLPVATLTVDTGAGMKSVVHDPGCNDAPGFLRILGARIDSMTGTSRWIAGKGAAR